MSAKTISLDIIRWPGSALDIARSFPIAVPRALDLARHGKFVDGIIRDTGSLRKIDLSIDTSVRLTRFRTISMLDVALPEVANLARRRGIFQSTNSRPRRINLVEPLHIPYGSLDVRSGAVVSKYENGIRKTYPDLYARKLPTGLLARRAYKWTRSLYRQHRKQVLTVLFWLVVFSVPALSYVTYALSHGYETLEKIAHTRDPSTIRTLIRSARGDFERSSFLLAPFSWIPVDKVDTVDKIARWWLALTRWLDMIAQALPENMTTKWLGIKKWEQNPLSYRAASRDIFALESIGIESPTDWIAENSTMIAQAQKEFQNAWDLFAEIKPTGERTIRARQIGGVIERLSVLLGWAVENQAEVLNMLGHTNPQRYIVFNQNRDEIRANGGFPGSILSFTIYKGNILDYHGDDVYYYDWNLYPYKEIPPPGIALLTDSYGLRDVNYYPDFRDTLDKANRFIEKSGDASVTTGIAIHQWIIEDLIDTVGEVSVTGVTIPFTSHNFSLLMSTLVENKYARQNTPKDVLFQFGDALLSKIYTKNKALTVLDTLEKYMKNGEIMFASRDPEIDLFLDKYKKRLPWQCDTSATDSSGALIACNPNWIYPIWTSVSGNKSDRYMSRDYTATTRKIDTCRYENTITLWTKHNYATSDKEELQSYFKTFGITNPEERAKLDFIQWDGKNRAYVRVFVPLGSTLVWTGSDITTTNNENATVFSTLIETPVGARTNKSWKYTLDIPNCVNYDGKIDWTRQPGLREVNIK